MLTKLTKEIKRISSICDLQILKISSKVGGGEKNIVLKGEALLGIKGDEPTSFISD